jgi:hypothetical protein
MLGNRFGKAGRTIGMGLRVRVQEKRFEWWDEDELLVIADD